MILPKPERRVKAPKYLRRSVPPRPQKLGPRATLFRECKALWRTRVLEKNGGICVLAGYDEFPCGGPLDPMHLFPKGACPAARLEIDLGLPGCRRHHRHYGNGEAFRAFLLERYGASRYQELYRLAHTVKKLDVAAIRAELAS